MDKQRFFIALDGTDGSGKGTQTKLLCDRLEEWGIPYRHLDFPTYQRDWSALLKLYLDGGFGSDPNAVNAYAASSFFSLDRYCSYMLDWRADYEAGKVIVANRYTTANAVHQLSKLPEAEYDGFLEWLFGFEQGKLGLPYPDLVIYLALEPDISMKLVEKRCRETGVKQDIHEKNRAHLLSACKAAAYACEKLGWKRIDCEENGVLRPVENIQSDVISVVREALAGKDML